MKNKLSGKSNAEWTNGQTDIETPCAPEGAKKSLTNQGSYDVHKEDQIELYCSNKLDDFHDVTKAFDVGVVDRLVNSGDVLPVWHEVGKIVTPPVSSNSKLTR